MKRLYLSLVLEHLKDTRQMLFLMGARQVGKTTTCVALADKFTHFYFTWDDPTDRELILKGPREVAAACGLNAILLEKPIVVFDEIHKYSDWKGFLKGFYDLYSEKIHILVTGSARLDVYKKGGDSLMGRYFLYHFHPISIAEISTSTLPKNEIRPTPKQISEKQFQNLWEFGGYPDPFIKANKRFFNRWSLLRFQQLFQEDIRDLTKIQELKLLETLAQLLKLQVGQQTSYDSLAKKIKVSGHTIRHWIEVLRSVYYCFEIRPWSANISRALIKEPKYFLWDWSGIEDVGARAENFVASHLLKAVHFWTDSGLGRYDLHYIRDKDQREVDFVVTKNDKPWFLVEVKVSGNKGISPSLYHFQKATGAEHAFQVVIDLPFVKKNCFLETTPVIVPAKTFLSQLI